MSVDASRILVFNGDGNVRIAHDPSFVNQTESRPQFLETPLRRRPVFKSLTSPSLRESDLQFWTGDVPPPLDPPDVVAALNVRRVVKKTSSSNVPINKLTPPRPRRDISPSIDSSPLPHRTDFDRTTSPGVSELSFLTSKAITDSVLGDYRPSNVVPPPRDMSKRWISPPCRSYSHTSDVSEVTRINETVPPPRHLRSINSPHSITSQRREVIVEHRSASRELLSPEIRSLSVGSTCTHRRSETPPPSKFCFRPETSPTRSVVFPDTPVETFRFRSTLPQTPIISTSRATSPARPVKQHWVPSQQWVTSMFSQHQQTTF